MKILGDAQMLRGIDRLIQNCSDSLKPVEITSKGGKVKGNFAGRPYLLKTLKQFHDTYKVDGNAYNLFPKDINGKRHLAYHLTSLYSLKNPINIGQIELEELEKLFEWKKPDLMAGTPDYLGKVINLDKEYFSQLKVVVGGTAAPDKQLIEKIKGIGAKPYWTYGATEFMDAFTTLEDFDEGYYVHQGKFSYGLDDELVYSHQRLKVPIIMDDTGEIIEKGKNQFIGTYSIRRL